MYMKIAAILLSLWLCEGRFLGVVDERLPKYQLHTVNNEDIVVKPGETLELECRGQEPGSVIWMFPRKSDAEEGEDPTYTVSTQVVIEGGNTHYMSKLTVPNITSNDTGEYECSCAGLAGDTLHMLSHHMGGDVVSERMVYVYVSDPEELFQEEQVGVRQPITGLSKSYVYLPCAVNNPATTVELLRARGYKRFSPVHMDDRKYSYTPQKGFKIDRLSVRDSGAYTCQATEGERVERKDFYLHVMRRNPLLVTPVLRTDMEAVGAGMSNSFKCQVMAGNGQMVAITWWKISGDEEPRRIEETGRIHIEDVKKSETICSGNRLMCSLLRHSTISATEHSLYSKWVGRLRINHTDSSDSGIYYCQATSDGRSAQSNRVNFRVSTVSVASHGGRNTAAHPHYSILAEGKR